MLYSHEDGGLSDIWEVIRDPRKVEQDREMAKRNRPAAAMFANVMAIGQSMLQAVETGEYVGGENRAIERDRSHEAKADAKQKTGLAAMRSAESARRLAKMTDDVREMERRAAVEDDDYYRY